MFLSKKTMTPIDGLRIFVGGLLVYAWWTNGFGLLDQFVGPSLRATIAAPDQDGVAFAPGIVSMLVSVVFGLLWLIGLVGIFAITIAWSFCQSMIEWGLKIVLSFFQGGRDWFDASQSQPPPPDETASDDQPSSDAPPSTDVPTRSPALAADLAAELRLITKHVVKAQKRINEQSTLIESQAASIESQASLIDSLTERIAALESPPKKTTTRRRRTTKTADKPKTTE
ncbi:hypothetical protein [Roseiconus lacunae]|uniref:Uncharacterized protein n=1 Tax=Roseiconus lacunae TaxID=2605694 RepID=A0ABT7PH58_9BACT|nr:hypothetical protein [Roseiconus lacunae]MDM4015817.1 hypothetical protein [Roseiconus lacunae]